MKQTLTDYFCSIKVLISGVELDFTAESSEFLIGRSSDCEVAIDDVSISRQHLKVFIVQDKIYFEDLGSSNGTFYESHKIKASERLQFVPGTKLQLGIKDTTVSFEMVKREVPQPLFEETVIHTKERNFEKDYEEKIIAFENEKRDFERKKAALIGEAQAKGQLEYQKQFKEAQLILQNAEKKSHETLLAAQKEAEDIKNKVEAEFRVEIKRTQDKNEALRNALLAELKELRAKAELEAEEFLKKAKHQANTIEKNAEQRKTEMLDRLQLRENEIEKEGEEILALARENAIKKASDIVAKSEEEQKKLSAIQEKLKEAEMKREKALGEFEKLAAQIEKRKADIAALEKSKEELKSLEIKKQEVLRDSEKLRRTAEDQVKAKTAEVESLQKNYEKDLERKKAHEASLFQELREKLQKDVAEEEKILRASLAAQKDQLTENLTRFIQLYHVENPDFQWATIKEERILAFKKVFHQNLMDSIGVQSPAKQAQSDLKKSSRATSWLMVGAAILVAVFVVPPFLPAPYNSKLALFDHTRTSERFLASIQENRNRRYEPEKVKQVFDTYALSVLLTSEFSESRNDDKYLRTWYREAERHFFRKFRISEERMVQILAKETSLVKGLQEQLKEVHPDYFSVSYKKMTDLEKSVLQETRRLFANDSAYSEFIEMSKNHFTKNKLSAM